MARIKVNSSELNSAYKCSKTLVSKCEDAETMVKAVIAGMDDSNFSAKSGIMADLHSLNKRASKQADLMRQYGSMILAIEDELRAADASFADGSSSIWGNVRHWIAAAMKKILPFSSETALGKQIALGSVFVVGAVVTGSAKIGTTLKVWINKVFGRKGEKDVNRPSPIVPSRSIDKETVGFTNVGTESNPRYNIEPYAFFQNDGPWAKVKYDGPAEIGKTGCLITSIAMVESLYQRRQITPDNAITELEMFFSNGRLKRGEPWYGLLDGFSGSTSYKPEKFKSLEQIVDKLKNGPVIIGGDGKYGTHYMVVTGYTGDGLSSNMSDFIVRNPDKWTPCVTLADYPYSSLTQIYYRQ